MMKNTSNMFWGDIHDVKRFTENINENKTKIAKKNSSIILASVQLMENFVKGIKNLSVYDAASIIMSEANWIQKNTLDEFKDTNNKKTQIEIGKVYYIDYGKSFCGELAYYHYGLCIGKRDGKILVIPMTSGTKIFQHTYHPVNNPHANKKNRQGLTTEGFGKDCVLKMNDIKFISAGRIEKETVSIDENILRDIQLQAFQVCFGELYAEYQHDKKELDKKDKKIKDQVKMIDSLKKEKNHLQQIINKKNSKISNGNIDTKKQ